ncbi:MAG: ferredoxin--NADP reductase, partial [Planctomycetota bacterium]
EALDTRAMERVVKRAYSISCRLLDDAGDVAPAGDEAEPEVYIALVTEADKPPAFTPRLFLLKEGDRIQMGAKAKGHFTLGDPGVDGVRPTDNVVFAGTGTGEAPHNAMLSKLLAEHHQGKIANICCARYRSDLGYLDEHARLMEKFPGYRYVPLTTREPENRDKDHPQYVGARYVQALMASPTAADELGFELDPATTKVFLCGNPAMIGIPNKDGHPDGRHPKPQGAVEVLEGLGFKAHEARAKEGEAPGNIFYEKYW